MEVWRNTKCHERGILSESSARKIKKNQNSLLRYGQNVVLFAAAIMTPSAFASCVLLWI